MTCETCETNSCCSSSPLTYGWVWTEITWDMVTAILNNVNVQQAILDVVWDLSWAWTCQNVADCITWSPETIWALTTLINSLIWDINCDDVAWCLSQTASIDALATLVAWSNTFKTAIVNLIASETDNFTCDDVATCISSNSWTQDALGTWLWSTIKKVWPITRSSWTTKSVTDTLVTSASVVLSRWITSWTQAWNRTWNSTSWNILFTSTATENVSFYYVVFI